MRGILKFALTPFLAFAATSHAVQKCVAPDGSVSYVDVCPTGTKPAESKVNPQLIPKPGGTIPRKPAPPAAGPEVAPKTARRAAKPEAPLAKDVRFQYYDVEAASFSAARNAVAARPTGPVRAAWQMSYEYKVRQSAGRCSLGTLSTKLDLTVTLPRWNPPAGTPEEEVELWRHYVEALRLAEDLRLDHARAFEQSLPAELLALPPAESCTAFEAAMKSRYDALRAQAQARFADHR